MAKFFKISILYILLPLVLIWGAVFGTQYYINHEQHETKASAEYVLQDEVDKLEDELEFSNTQLKVTVEEKVAQQQQLESAQKELEEFDGSIKAIWAEIQEKETQITSLQVENAQLQETVNGILDQADKEELLAKIESNQSKIAELTSEVQTLRSQADTLSAKVESLNERIREHSQKVSSLQTMIDNIEANIALTTNQIEQIKRAIESLKVSGVEEVVVNSGENGKVSYILFQNGLCIQWGQNVCDSKGHILQTLQKEYTNTGYLILMTPTNQKTTLTVWAVRVYETEVATNSFGGYYTYNTGKSSGFSNGGGYRWMTIGMINN